MSSRFKKIITALVLSSLMACTRPEEAEREKIRQRNMHAEYIYRESSDRFFELSSPKHCPREKYPWEEKQ